MDWEAILTQHPSDFIAAMAKWLIPTVGLTPEQATARTSAAPPPRARASPDVAASDPQLVFPPVSEVVPVDQVLATIRQRLEALNGEKEKRI